MFAKLKGILDSASGDTVVIDVGGVGYLASASAKTIHRLPPIGQPVALVIETHVREDKIQLFAFSAEAERDMFRLLQTIQGIGGKAALSILSVLSPDELVAAIASGDKAAVGRADGVGPKLATRVVTELKDKIAKLSPFGASLSPSGSGGASGIPSNTNHLPAKHDDAISALVNLGYSRMDAFRAVSAAVQTIGANASIESIIPAALKELAA